jgi:hypothetical protein
MTGFAFLVGGERIYAGGERTRPPRGAQPHVYPVECAMIGLRGERAGTTVVSAEPMQSTLQKMQVGVAALGSHQFLVRPILDDASPLKRDDPIGAAHGR